MYSKLELQYHMQFLLYEKVSKSIKLTKCFFNVAFLCFENKKNSEFVVICFI